MEDNFRSFYNNLLDGYQSLIYVEYVPDYEDGKLEEVQEISDELTQHLYEISNNNSDLEEKVSSITRDFREIVKEDLHSLISLLAKYKKKSL